MNHRIRRFLVAAALGLFILPLAVNAQAPDDTTIVMAQGVDISSFDPSAAASRSDTNILGHIFATLYEVDDGGKFVPYLAKSYTISDDGKEWTFELNSGLTCDDGEALTAEDVAYSFDRATDPANAFTGNTTGFVLPSIEYVSTKVVDDTHVTIVTNTAQSEPLRLGLISEVYIHCKDSYEKMSLEEASQHPVGSGPYKLVEWVPDDHVTLEKVPGFTLRTANFEKQVWRVIPEASTRTAELLAGNVDIIANVSPDQVDAINNSGTATVESVAGTRRMYVGFQFSDTFKDAPGYDALQKTDVRVALQYAIDVPTICKTLLGTDCVRASSMVNDPNGDPNLSPYPYDPKKAGELLDAAGYPAGPDGVRFETVLMGPRGRYLNDANVVQAIGQYLTDVGVKTTVDIRDWTSDYLPLVRTKDVGPMFFLGSGGGIWSALYDMADLSAPDAGTNYTNWQNPEWFKLWNEAQGVDLETEKNLVNQMLEVFYNDPPWLLLYFQPDFYAKSNRVDWTARRDEQIVVTDATLASS
ncbi:MAG: ABC transporter substrate-binding protein [Chloroflexi bacterium]|nr:ABC transporter substrate-binding protein [Chloroflexota bacterium]